MAGVITIPNQRPSILADFLQRRLQEQTAQQQAQAEQQRNDLLKQQVTGQQNQASENAQEQIAQAQAKAFMDNQVQAMKDDPAALSQAATQFASSNPRAGKYLVAYSQGRPVGTGDLISRATDAGKLSDITAANSGSQDAQKQNAAFMLKYNQQLSAPSFADQAQKQTTQPGLVDPKSAYGQSLAIQGERAPSANQIQQGQTAKEVAGIQGQTQKDVAGMQIAANAPLVAAQTAAERARAVAETSRARLSDAQVKQMLDSQDIPSMVTGLVNRTTSLDDLAKKGTALREHLRQLAEAQGVIAPSNEKERSDLVGADNTAQLMKARIDNLRALAPVVDSAKNRVAIAGLLNAGDGVFSNFVKGAARNMVDPRVLDYVQELRNLREDQFALRKYLGNSPVRSDKQVAIMLAQSVGADAGSGKDVIRMLNAFEPAVNRLIIGNQVGGKPQLGGAASASKTGKQNDPLGILQ